MAIRDIEVSKAIIKRYTQELLSYLESDAAIVGGGPAGLTAAYYLAAAGKKVAVFERKLSLGGGMWGGGIMFNSIVVQEEALEILEEFKISYSTAEKGYYTADAVEAVCSLGAQAVKAGAKIFNLLSVEDLLVQEKRIAGVVLNWTAVEMAGLHIDPIALEAKAVVDATGHDCQVITKAQEKLVITLPTPSGKIMGEKSMYAEEGEKKTLDNTREIYPGLYVAGMAANAVFGDYRMGPIFGSMLLSGKKVAGLIKSS